jgi:hypothetical protein
VVQRREHFGFALEPSQAFRIGDEGSRQDFYRNLSFQASIRRAIHFAHPARAELAFNPKHANF